MKVRYTDGQIQIDIYELLANTPKEQKAVMIEVMACDDDIIKHIVDQLLQGWTENDLAGVRNYTAIQNPKSGLDWACREIAKRSSEVARKEIERLETAVKTHRDEYLEEVKENITLREKLVVANFGRSLH